MGRKKSVLCRHGGGFILSFFRPQAQYVGDGIVGVFGTVACDRHEGCDEVHFTLFVGIDYLLRLHFRILLDDGRSVRFTTFSADSE
jgi:hypothetical protein